jgi:hypothetical protein
MWKLPRLFSRRSALAGNSASCIARGSRLVYFIPSAFAILKLSPRRHFRPPASTSYTSFGLKPCVRAQSATDAPDLRKSAMPLCWRGSRRFTDPDSVSVELLCFISTECPRAHEIRSNCVLIRLESKSRDSAKFDLVCIDI